MAIIEYALGDFPRDGLWAITCENGCRPEAPMSFHEIKAALRYSLSLALSSEAMDAGSDDFDELELHFLMDAANELNDDDLIEEIQKTHKKLFEQSLIADLEEVLFADIMERDYYASQGTGSAGV